MSLRPAAFSPLACREGIPDSGYEPLHVEAWPRGSGPALERRTREMEDRESGKVALHRLQERDVPSEIEPEIRDEERDTEARLQQLSRGLDIARGYHDMALALEGTDQQLPQRHLRLENQDARRPVRRLHEVPMSVG